MSKLASLILVCLLLPFLGGCEYVGYTLVSLPYLATMPIAVATYPHRAKEIEKSIQPSTFAGIVVDEDGNPVPNVHLLIAYDRPEATVFGSDSDYLCTSRNVTGPFQETIPGSIHALRVSAPNYYTQEYQTYKDTLTPLNIAGHRISNGPQQPLTSARIVLRTHGPLTRLDFRRETIWVDASGTGVVIHPSHPSTAPGTAQWAPSVENAPADFLFVTTTRAAGVIPTTQVQACDCSLPMPTEIRIGVAGPGNGIQLYTPKSEDELWYEMHQAPANGYQPSLTLDDNAREDLVGSHGIWFFIKSGNYYGRGHIEDAELTGRHSDSLPRFGLRLLLEMQPDGTRNLDQDPSPE